MGGLVGIASSFFAYRQYFPPLSEPEGDKHMSWRVQESSATIPLIGVTTRTEQTYRNAHADEIV